MSWPWLKNTYLTTVTGPLSEDEMKDIPYPVVEVGVHITQRTIEAGSLIGVLAAAAYRLAKFGATDKLAVRMTTKRIAGGGALLGVFVGPVITIARMSTQSEEAIYDRCYRLRNNRGQVAADYFATPPGIVGGVVRGASGFAWGTIAGLVAFAGYTYFAGADASTATTYHTMTPTKVMKQTPWLNLTDDAKTEEELKARLKAQMQDTHKPQCALCDARIAKIDPQCKCDCH